MIDVLAKKLNINHIPFSPHNIPTTGNVVKEEDTVKQSGLIIYTSGTTGRPKGVLHTFYSLNSQVMIILFHSSCLTV